jgi:hypothetical protein
MKTSKIQNKYFRTPKINDSEIKMQMKSQPL